MEKAIIDYAYLSAFYPTRRHRKARVRKVTDFLEIPVTELEEKDFPVIVKSSAKSFSEAFRSSALRGYKGFLFQPAQVGSDMHIAYRNHMCVDREDLGTYTEKSVDVPEEKLMSALPGYYYKGYLREAVLKRIHEKYDDTVLFHGELWTKAEEPYVRVTEDPEAGYDVSLVHSEDTSLMAAGSKYTTDGLKVKIFEFRLDDWLNKYRERFGFCGTSPDDIEVSGGFEKYFHNTYYTCSHYDRKYHLDMEGLPSVNYKYTVNAGAGDKAIVIRFRPTYSDEHYFIAEGCGRDTAVVQFFENNPYVEYDEIEHIAEFDMPTFI